MTIDHVNYAIPRPKEELPRQARLDRSRWVVGVIFNSYGLRIGIRTNDAASLAFLPSRLPPERRSTTVRTVDRLYSLIAGKQRNGKTWRLSAYANEKRLTRRQSIGLVLDELERDLQQHLAEHAKTRLFIHAGVVAVGGIAIVIPGRSYTGKSTLVREFVRAGAAYYSDEYAVLDSRGQVHPYARQLALREGANGTMIRVTAESLGGQIGKRPLPLGLVLVAPFRDGAKWRPRRLSTGQAAMALVRNTVAARQRPSDMLDILQKALAQAVAWQGARGEAAQVVEAVLGILSYSP